MNNKILSTLSIAALAPTISLQAMSFEAGDLKAKVVTDELVEKSLTLNDYSGADVVDAKGNKIGVVHDLKIDANDGEILSAYISVGGILGIGDNILRVPFSQLDYNTKDKNFSLPAFKSDIERSIDMATHSWDEKARAEFNEAAESTERFLESTWVKIKEKTGLNEKELADIEIYSKRGKVYLEGTVANPKIRNKVVMNAREEYDMEVVNRITVSG